MTATQKDQTRILASMFGAKGDGVTDDRAALAAWITALNSAAPGAYGVLHPGQYNISTPLPTITASAVTIQGAGWAQTDYTKGSVITAASGYTDSGPMINISGEGVSLQRLTIDGANRSTAQVATTGGNNQFQFMSTHGCKTGGVCLDIQNGAISAWIHGCRINGVNYTNTGIQINDTDAIITATKPTNNTYNFVLLAGASGTIIADNHMTPGSGGVNCIWISGSPSHVSIDGNRFDNYVKACIQIDPTSSSPNNIVITNNQFHSAVQTDDTFGLIQVDTSASSVRGLHVCNNTGYGAASHRAKYGIVAQKQDGTAATNTTRLKSLGSLFNSNTFWVTTAMAGTSPTVMRGNMMALDGQNYSAAIDI